MVGVLPDAQGGGLGKALTSIGLHHLASDGLPTAMLYVDADNTAAVRCTTGGLHHPRVDRCTAPVLRPPQRHQFPSLGHCRRRTSSIEEKLSRRE
ncbi:Mycothiol acetyltransferase [Streptomyces californicus]